MVVKSDEMVFVDFLAYSIATKWYRFAIQVFFFLINKIIVESYVIVDQKFNLSI